MERKVEVIQSRVACEAGRQEGRTPACKNRGGLLESGLQAVDSLT